MKRLSQTDQNSTGLIGNDATSSYKGQIQLNGDLSGTASSPQVVSTHLAVALPVSQGGTGTTTSTGSGSVVLSNSPTLITPNIGAAIAGGDFTLSTHNLITDTSTGSKIGTATNQKLGFFNATPIVQPSGDALTALSNLGLVSSPTLSESDITNLTSDLAAKALDSSVAHLAGSEIITGAKTFNAGTLLDKGNQVFNVKAYGAKCDRVSNSDGAVTAGTAAFTSASGSFTSSDIGKTIIVPGAGASGACLVTTISAVSSGTAITLAANASTTVSGATYYYGTDDTTTIQTAATAATGNILYIPAPTITTSSINLPSNIAIWGPINLGASISTGMSNANNGIFNITNKNNIDIGYIAFSVNGNSTAITSYGHNGLKIHDSDFSGTTISTVGVIHTAGDTGSANYENTKIFRNKFHDMVGTGSGVDYTRTIHLYARGSYIVEGVEVFENLFTNVYGVCTYLDQYNYIRDIEVHHNRYIDIPGGNGVNNCAMAVQTRVSDNGGYYWEDLNVHHNYYRNTLTTSNNANQNQNFICAYSGKRLTVTQNHMIGAWTSSNSLHGPAIAVGRTIYPQLGGVIQGNVIEGFDSPIDFDSTTNMDISGNVVRNCGNNFYLGYGIQQYNHIHHNICYNSIPTDYSGVGTIFANSSPVMCSFRDNLIIDDRSVRTPTGIVATLQSGGSLTATTTYYYKVTALDSVGETLASSEVNATTTSSNKKILITWNVMPGASSYRIYRSTTSGSYGATSLLTTVSIVPSNTNTANQADDGTVALTSGSPPGSSTVATAVMTKAIELTGNFNFSQIKVTGNRYYLPNASFSSSSLFTKEQGSETIPTTVYGNEMIDSTGTVLVDSISESYVTNLTTDLAVKSSKSFAIAMTVALG